MSNYFTMEDSTTLIYYQMPKVLIHGDTYKKMKGDAKILYVICLDLVKLSMKNNWVDEEGKVYIKLSIESIKSLIGCSNDKATALKKDLLLHNLLEEVRLGQGKTNRIYLKKLNFTEDDITQARKKVESSVGDENQNSENQNTEENSVTPMNSENQNSENRNSRIPKIGKLDTAKSEPINNNINKTYPNKEKDNNNNIYISKEENYDQYSEMTHAEYIENERKNGREVIPIYNWLEV